MKQYKCDNIRKIKSCIGCGEPISSGELCELCKDNVAYIKKEIRESFPFICNIDKYELEELILRDLW